eukprot:TRINITY_DN20147_c0_g1_i1.p1 TRINITY_DN20147_c0_g1~~TRINITY_DN20147_c0_g1_i1.p1  ORF type:complete len:359 (+),score=122.72 TRINITY_DN20147_c0_g1_i1:53-1078(+)
MAEPPQLSDVKVSDFRKDADTARYLVSASVLGVGYVERWRRYSEFAALRRALQHIPRLPNLPPKTLLAVKSAEELGRRRKALHEFLVFVGKHAKGKDQRELLQFVSSESDQRKAGWFGKRMPPPAAAALAPPTDRQPHTSGPESPLVGSNGEEPSPGTGSPPAAPVREETPPAEEEPPRDPDDELWEVVGKARNYFLDATHVFTATDEIPQEDSEGEFDWSEGQMPQPRPDGSVGLPEAGPGVRRVAPAVDEDWAGRMLRRGLPPPQPHDRLRTLGDAVLAAFQRAESLIEVAAKGVVTDFPLQVAYDDPDEGTAPGPSDSPQTSHPPQAEAAPEAQAADS